MPEVEYSVIGQGSRHEVYMLHGVKGGVIAIVHKDSRNDIIKVILAIRCIGSIGENIYKIREEFVNSSVELPRGYHLYDTWGWRGCISEYPEISKYKALYVNAYLGHTNQKYKCIEEIKDLFRKLKLVYDRNTIR